MEKEYLELKKKDREIFDLYINKDFDDCNIDISEFEIEPMTMIQRLALMYIKLYQSVYGA